MWKVFTPVWRISVEKKRQKIYKHVYTIFCIFGLEHFCIKIVMVQIFSGSPCASVDQIRGKEWN